MTQSLGNDYIGKLSDQTWMSVEIDNSVVLGPAGKLIGIFLAVALNQYPLDFTHHTLADPGSLAVHQILQPLQPFFLNFQWQIIRQAGSGSPRSG